MSVAAQPDPRHVAEGQPACWGVDPELFFGPADSPAHGPVLAWEHKVLAVCATCPVAAACLTAALAFPADEQHGVIGGTTAGQRRALLRSARQRPVRSSMTETVHDRQRLVRAAVRLHQSGHNARWIAARLQVGERRVQRWLIAQRIDGGGR